MIEDVSDAFFSNYTIGEDINEISDFNQATVTAEAININLEPEDKNNKVKTLQKVLKCLGYFPADIDPTCLFNPITEQAVKDFQSAKDIKAVGYVEPAAKAAFNNL